MNHWFTSQHTKQVHHQEEAHHLSSLKEILWNCHLATKWCRKAHELIAGKGSKALMAMPIEKSTHSQEIHEKSTKCQKNGHVWTLQGWVVQNTCSQDEDQKVENGCQLSKEKESHHQILPQQIQCKCQDWMCNRCWMLKFHKASVFACRKKNMQVICWKKCSHIVPNGGFIKMVIYHRRIRKQQSP